VRVGATHTFNIGLIPECVALFLARHPTVRVRVDGARRRPDRREAARRRARPRHRLPAERADRPLVRAALQRGDGARGLRAAIRTTAGQRNPHGSSLHQPRSRAAALSTSRPRHPARGMLQGERAPSRSSVAEFSPIAPMLGPRVLRHGRSARSPRSTAGACGDRRPWR
jgi:hypothetical protein